MLAHQDSESSGAQEERGLLDSSSSGSSNQGDLSPPRISGDRISQGKVQNNSGRGRTDDRESRGREIGRQQTERNPSNKPSRSTSLSRYSNFIRRGRSASATLRHQQNQFLLRSLSPHRLLYSHHQEDSANHEPTHHGIPYTAVVRKNSFGSGESSLTTDQQSELSKKPRSKSLIRSAIQHLGISSKKKHDQDFDDTQVTESTANTVEDSQTSSSHTATPQWDPSHSILKDVGQLDIIDSDSEEDGSCATRSEQGHNESRTSLNIEEVDTYKYEQVYNSCEHPLFTTLGDQYEASGDVSDLSFTNRNEQKPKRWASIGAAIGRGRSLSVSRRKIKEENKTNSKPEDDAGIDLSIPSQRSNSLKRHLSKKSVNQPITTQRKLRSASVDAMNRMKTSKKSKTATHRSISVSRMPSKKKAACGVDLSTAPKPEFLPSAVKPRKKKVKCIVCRKRLSKGKCIEHIDLYFCAGSDDQSSCFQCVKCHFGLDQLIGEDDNARLSGCQVISNARGSIVQCGECAKATWMSVAPEMSESSEAVKADEDSIQIEEDAVKDTPRIFTCASCNGDFYDYKGEIQVIGENTYHSACLRRESLKQSGLLSDSLALEINSADEEVTPADAASKLAEKVVVKLSVEVDGRDEREYLSATFFKWLDKNSSLSEIKEAEKVKRMEKFLRNDDSPIDLSLEISYELDAQAFGNPNYSGHFASNGIICNHKYSPRKTSIEIPMDLEVDEDGRISTNLVAELQWVDRFNTISPEHFSSTLTLEPFPFEGNPVKKVMNQMWRYEQHGLYHEFTFSCPFESDFLSWEIAEGDVLDLTECRFDVFIDQSEHESAVEMPQHDPLKVSDSLRMSKLTSSVTSTEGCDWESRAEQLISEVDSLRDFDATRELSHSLPPEKCADRRSSSALSHCPPPSHKEQSLVKLDPDGDEITNVSELLSVARSGGHLGVSLPRIVHVKARKEFEDDDTGLSLIQSNGSCVVAEVSKSGLFSSKLNEGSVVLAINGRPVKSPRQFMRLFKDADDKVNIMASDSPPIPGSVYSVVRKEKGYLPDFERWKSNPEDTTDALGISFEMINGLVRVREVCSDGIFADSRISKGDVCLMVDGVPATNLNTTVRALALARGVIPLLTFSLHNLWSNLLDLMISEEYRRHWRGSECELAVDIKHPFNIHFDSVSGLCFEGTSGTEIMKPDLSKMNTIIERVMNMLIQSIQVCREPSDSRSSRGSSCCRTHSVSVSPNGSVKRRSDVYRRALIKLEEMKSSGKLSMKDYNDAKHALASVAIKSNN